MHSLQYYSTNSQKCCENVDRAKSCTCHSVFGSFFDGSISYGWISISYNLKLLYSLLAWENRRCFVTPPTVCPRNDAWEISQAARPIRNTIQIWVVTRHQYGISALVSQTSFRGETVGGGVECCLFSQANSPRISKRYSKLIPSERRYYLIYSWHLLVFLKQNSITYLNYKLEI